MAEGSTPAPAEAEPSSASSINNSHQFQSKQKREENHNKLTTGSASAIPGHQPPKPIQNSSKIITTQFQRLRTLHLRSAPFNSSHSESKAGREQLKLPRPSKRKPI
ncbi:hypothetical protein Nepgr_015867 [Nepenthes gracilis]|uniref:Uncharacterized protein n=1 Tax=Nepenthes gracilis TaxID=150966 RepID=A0AAD3XRP8_NEPGR|nr:hypothetical protein Nepgr_015867 [Nepenthes gracilis]